MQDRRSYLQGFAKKAARSNLGENKEFRSIRKRPNQPNKPIDIHFCLGKQKFGIYWSFQKYAQLLGVFA